MAKIIKATRPRLARILARFGRTDHQNTSPASCWYEYAVSSRGL